MYARVTELAGISPADKADHLQHFEDDILPRAEEIPGMCGGMVLTGEDGHAIVITLWQDEPSLLDSREQASVLRDLAFQRMNLTRPAVIREYEVGVAHLNQTVLAAV
jgi:hypothetical protein